MIARRRSSILAAAVGAAAIAVLGLLTAGCRSRRCDGAGEAVVEVRERDGRLVFTLRPRGQGLAICDAEDHRLGDLVGGRGATTATATGRLVLTDPAGGEVLSIAPGPDPGDSLLRRGDGTVWRLHDEDGLVRLLDPEGVPLAQLGYERGAASPRAVAFDPAGSPLATAERADAEGDRRVLRARDGAVTRILLGVSDDRAAAALALDRLPPVERLALVRWLDRPGGARR